MPGLNPRFEVTVPGDAPFLDLVDRNLREFGRHAGLTADAVATLTEAVIAAGQSLLTQSAEPGRPGAIVVSAEITPTDLMIGIDDRGLPLDPSQPSDPVAAPVGPAADRLHLVADEVRWVNLGRAGLELQLAKHRPVAHLTDRVPAADLTRSSGSVPLAPDQTYTIRRLRPADAIGVARCIYEYYGYEYPNEDVYYPDRIVHQNATGELISVVAVDAVGEVVGHYALERPGLGPIAETGQAVVSARHGHRGLLEKMRTALEAAAADLGLAGIYGQPVTSHTFSQRMDLGFGAYVRAVSLAHSPPINFTQIRDQAVGQRETLLICFKHLGAEPGATPVHAPDHHRAIIDRIYAQYGVHPAPPAGTSRGLPPGPGRISAGFDRGWGYATIRVNEIGADTAVAVDQARRDLIEVAGVPVIYLELPLAQPGTPDLCRAAESMGFCFSGVGPCFAPDGDVLRLQYLNTPLDPAKLQIASPFGQELLAYIVAEQDRVRG